MPYITEAKRVALATSAHVLGNSMPADPGELNYEITRMIQLYLRGERSYAIFNEVIGVLECAKLELYRRMVAPYEDQKCAENGDVY